MYAIIYWLNDDEVYPLLANDNQQIKIFETLKEADQTAFNFESEIPKAECRVISISGVKE